MVQECGTSSWEVDRRRVWILKEYYEVWKKLKESGGFASDTKFYAHLLDTEEARQRSLEPQ